MRVHRRPGEQRGVVAEPDPAAADRLERPGGGPGQRVQVGAGRVGAVRVEAVAAEQRVAAADQHDPRRRGRRHHRGGEPVVRPERLAAPPWWSASSASRPASPGGRRAGRRPCRRTAGRRRPRRAGRASCGPTSPATARRTAAPSAGPSAAARATGGGRPRGRQRQAGRREHLGGLGDRGRVVEAEPAGAEVEAVGQQRRGRAPATHEPGGGAPQPPAGATRRRVRGRADVACVTFRHLVTLPAPRSPIVRAGH